VSYGSAQDTIPGWTRAGAGELTSGHGRFGEQQGGARVYRPFEQAAPLPPPPPPPPPMECQLAQLISYSVQFMWALHDFQQPYRCVCACVRVCEDHVRVHADARQGPVHGYEAVH